MISGTVVTTDDSEFHAILGILLLLIKILDLRLPKMHRVLDWL
jgi:hypothetical protein